MNRVCRLPVFSAVEIYQGIGFARGLIQAQRVAMTISAMLLSVLTRRKSVKLTKLTRHITLITKADVISNFYQWFTSFKQ